MYCLNTRVLYAHRIKEVFVFAVVCALVCLISIELSFSAIGSYLLESNLKRLLLPEDKIVSGLSRTGTKSVLNIADTVVLKPSTIPAYANVSNTYQNSITQSRLFLRIATERYLARVRAGNKSHWPMQCSETPSKKVRKRDHKRTPVALKPLCNHVMAKIILIRVPKCGSSYWSSIARRVVGCTPPYGPCCRSSKSHDTLKSCPEKGLYCER